MSGEANLHQLLVASTCSERPQVATNSFYNMRDHIQSLVTAARIHISRSFAPHNFVNDTS
jgi:hypothetical protein